MNKVLIYFVVIISFPVFAQASKPLEIKELAPGVYLHTSFKIIEGYGLLDSNGLIVIENNQAYIIDTPWSEEDTKLLLSWVADKGYKATASISTHSHDDRTAGISLLNSKLVRTYTSELTKALLVREGKQAPTHTFKGDNHIFLDGLIELYYPGAGHTADNIVVWLPKHKILFGGCIVRSYEWKSLGNVRDASISSWANSIKNIKSKKYDIQTIVPGHGDLGKADILDHTYDLASSAYKKLMEAAKASDD